jgi:hypothetical protein
VRADPASLLPPAPRGFSATLVTNRHPSTLSVEERTVDAGATATRTRPLDLSLPADVYSLSHIALPFPVSDSLYGHDPDPPDAFGLSLGVMATRGERNVLAVASDELARMTSNPFFPYMIERIAEAIDQEGRMWGDDPPHAPRYFQGGAGWSGRRFGRASNARDVRCLRHGNRPCSAGHRTGARPMMPVGRTAS